MVFLLFKQSLALMRGLIAWYQERGAGVQSGGTAGRSFYTSLGHLNEIWEVKNARRALEICTDNPPHRTPTSSRTSWEGFGGLFKETRHEPTTPVRLSGRLANPKPPEQGRGRMSDQRLRRVSPVLPYYLGSGILGGGSWRCYPLLS